MYRILHHRLYIPMWPLRHRGFDTAATSPRPAYHPQCKTRPAIQHLTSHSASQSNISVSLTRKNLMVDRILRPSAVALRALVVLVPDSAHAHLPLIRSFSRL